MHSCICFVATGRRRSTTFVSDQARINLLKGELEEHMKQEDSPAYQSLCSQCNAEFEVRSSHDIQFHFQLQYLLFVSAIYRSV